MKITFLFLTAAFVALFQTNCQSQNEIRAERINACAKICSEHPQIKSMSIDEGGGILLFGGYQTEKCECVRGG